MPKYIDYTTKINRTIRQIQREGYEAPTLKGELRVRTETIIYQKGSKAGQIRPYNEIKEEFAKIGRNYTHQLYVRQIHNLEKTAEIQFKTLKGYEKFEKDKLINSIVNDLGFRYQNVYGGESSKKDTIEVLKKFKNLDELRDIFNDAANNSEQDRFGRFTKYSADEFGMKHYIEFNEKLSQIIKEHLNSI